MREATWWNLLNGANLFAQKIILRRIIPLGIFIRPILFKILRILNLLKLKMNRLLVLTKISSAIPK